MIPEYHYASINGILFRFENIVNFNPQIYYVVSKSSIYGHFFVFQRNYRWEIITDDFRLLNWAPDVKIQILKIISDLSYQ